MTAVWVSSSLIYLLFVHMVRIGIVRFAAYRYTASHPFSLAPPLPAIVSSLSRRALVPLHASFPFCSPFLSSRPSRHFLLAPPSFFPPSPSPSLTAPLAFHPRPCPCCAFPPYAGSSLSIPPSRFPCYQRPIARRGQVEEEEARANDAKPFGVGLVLVFGVAAGGCERGFGGESQSSFFLLGGMCLGLGCLGWWDHRHLS
ncbi:hypothetical protein B0H17DRAFT_477993 [Mycena rosella]|uniref:Uncharacterized protein n=1 Tax=Mycena rosella TaxID=1033263 RepID=A0AAD7C613_MYCRO|nr:hypothetical protein B0H17DRAFT_477993 [Mycena rosella]